MAAFSSDGDSQKLHNGSPSISLLAITRSVYTSWTDKNEMFDLGDSSSSLNIDNVEEGHLLYFSDKASFQSTLMNIDEAQLCRSIELSFVSSTHRNPKASSSLDPNAVDTVKSAFISVGKCDPILAPKMNIRYVHINTFIRIRRKLDSFINHDHPQGHCYKTFFESSGKILKNGHLAHDWFSCKGVILLPKPDPNSPLNRITEKERCRIILRKDKQEDEIFRARYAIFNNEVNSRIEKLNIYDFFCSTLVKSPNKNARLVRGRLKNTVVDLQINTDIWPKTRIPITLHSLAQENHFKNRLGMQLSMISTENEEDSFRPLSSSQTCPQPHTEEIHSFIEMTQPEGDVITIRSRNAKRDETFQQNMQQRLTFSSKVALMNELPVNKVPKTNNDVRKGSLRTSVSSNRNSSLSTIAIKDDMMSKCKWGDPNNGNVTCNEQRTSFDFKKHSTSHTSVTNIDSDKRKLCYISRYDKFKSRKPKLVRDADKDMRTSRPSPIIGLANMSTYALEKYRERLFNNLPKYTKEEILAKRLSYIDYTFYNLHSNSLPLAAKFIQRMIQMDEDRRKFPLSCMEFGPELKENKAHLKRLADGLRETLVACQEGKYGIASEIFLEMGIVFMHNEVWWWLAEQMFKISIWFGKEMSYISDQFEMTSRYIYGMFLFTYLNEDLKAQKHLTIVVSKAKGKSWKAKVLHKQQDTLFHESKNLLSKVHIRKSVKALDEDKNIYAAKTFAKTALKLALIAENMATSMDAVYQMIRCVKPRNNYKTLLSLLDKFINFARKLNHKEKMCNGYKALCELLIQHQKMQEALLFLFRYRSIARLAGERTHQAEADLYIGRIHWGQHMYEGAVVFFHEAVILYDQLAMHNEKDNAITMLRMLGVEQKMPSHFKLISNNSDPKMSNNVIESSKIHLQITKPLSALSAKSSNTSRQSVKGGEQLPLSVHLEPNSEKNLAKQNPLHNIGQISNLQKKR